MTRVIEVALAVKLRVTFPMANPAAVNFSLATIDRRKEPAAVVIDS